MNTAHAQHNWRKDTTRVYWSNAIGIILMHAGCAWGIILLINNPKATWDAVLLSAFFWWLMGGVGICLGYHRLLTHRSFKCGKPLEYTLTILGAMSWEASPIRWVGQHRLHHSESDLPADPHTPHHGNAWSHIWWMFWHDPPELSYRNYAKDMLRDRGHVLIDRYARIFNIILGFGLWFLAEALGRDPVAWVLWGVCVRSVVVFHFTWLVNSLGHTVGYRNYETGDDSRNNWLVALLTFGEGWHNNHHADPRSARHGHRTSEVDLTFVLVVILEKLGLVWDVKRPTVTPPPRS